MFDLKPLSRDAIDAALVKAERDRLLNEPGQAESICLDVLAVDPDNQQAQIGLGQQEPFVHGTRPLLAQPARLQGQPHARGEPREIRLPGLQLLGGGLVVVAPLGPDGGQRLQGHRRPYPRHLRQRREREG